MGKYMRKAKIAGEVAVMEVLQRLWGPNQSQNPGPTETSGVNGDFRLLISFLFSESRIKTFITSTSGYRDSSSRIKALEFGPVFLRTEEKSSFLYKWFKGHDMLAPFTAGWHTTDLNPLVIERSQGCYVYDVNGKKYLDSLAGLWCLALAYMKPFPFCALRISMDHLSMGMTHAGGNLVLWESYAMGKVILGVGFGISKPEHVKQIAGWGAASVIVGSAAVKILVEAKSLEEGLKPMASL